MGNFTERHDSTVGTVFYSNNFRGFQQNRGSQKSHILKGCIIINHQFSGTPIFRKPHFFNESNSGNLRRGDQTALRYHFEWSVEIFHHSCRGTISHLSDVINVVKTMLGMVYRTYLWWFGGWFLVLSTTLPALYPYNTPTTPWSRDINERLAESLWRAVKMVKDFFFRIHGVWCARGIHPSRTGWKKAHIWTHQTALKVICSFWYGIHQHTRLDWHLSRLDC